MLGLNLDIQNEALNHHLTGIQAARKKRAQEQAEAINRHYGRTIVDLEKICSRCETFMNPHLIHAMIDAGQFDDFRSGRSIQKSAAMDEAEHSSGFCDRKTYGRNNAENDP